MKIDLLIKNAFVFMTYRQVFEKKDIAIVSDRIYRIADNLDIYVTEAQTVLDRSGMYIIPGLIDCHMHIESSMTYPSAFSEAVLKFGTTTVVSDPHEMANVFGLEGIRAFMSQETTLDIFYAMPSSVPSTAPEIETSGAMLGEGEINQLIDHPRVICLGEVMHFADLISEEDTRIKRIVKACQTHPKPIIIEGHCPRLSPEDLARFIGSGVDSDHTQQNVDDMLAKIDAGMFIELQKKSITKPIIDIIQHHQLYERIAFVTDDVMPDDLLKGHLNSIVQQAHALGMPFEKAIYCATFTPSKRMLLHDRGVLAPGKLADFIILKDRALLEPLEVYKNGRKYCPLPVKHHFSKAFYNTLHCRRATLDDFNLCVPPQNTSVEVNVMQLSPQGTFTKKVVRHLPVVNGCVQWVDSGLSLAALYERHGINGNISVGLVENALVHKGAIGTSWSHDSHNLLIIGNDPESMCRAQHRLCAIHGGFVVSNAENIIAELPLAIGGIVSDQSIETLGAQMSNVRSAIEGLGYVNQNVVMSVATLSLAVSPELKLTDKGLYNVMTHRFEPLILNEM